MRPVVGAVIPASSLKSVLLPAPLRPMMPTDEPRGTSRLTSRSAQNARGAARRAEAILLADVLHRDVEGAHTVSATVSSTYLK